MEKKQGSHLSGAFQTIDFFAIITVGSKSSSYRWIQSSAYDYLFFNN